MYTNAKKDYYACEFIKYKGDNWKTWDTLMDIVNKKKEKSRFPCILGENKPVYGAQTSPTNWTNTLLI